MLEIQAIEPYSIAEELGLQPGDRLLALNGEPVRDLIDYEILSRNEELLIEIERADGELWDLEIEKDAEEPLGLVLPHPEPTQCGNNCIFCFVHQLPRGLRKTLYVKDEDYRFSYLYGAYVTLTNLDQAALERILTQRLSPLYVSVHATDNELRTRLLGRKGPPILELLGQLVAGGIEVHAQIVICPEINDGEALERTFTDLVGLAPGIRSLALVPVGLTGYRERLPALRPVSADEARRLIDWVHMRQAECLARLGTRFVYAADELYLKAGLSFPELGAYEDFPQIENGVGLVANFRYQADEVLEQATPLVLPPVDLVTGVSAAAELQRFAAALNAATGLRLTVQVVSSRFFGGEVTVTGLLAGRDLLEQLPGRLTGDILLLPDVVLREGDDMLLDDVRIADLERQLGVRIEPIPSTPWGIWDTLEALSLAYDADEPHNDGGTDVGS